MPHQRVAFQKDERNSEFKAKQSETKRVPSFSTFRQAFPQSTRKVFPRYREIKYEESDYGVWSVYSRYVSFKTTDCRPKQWSSNAFNKKKTNISHNVE